MSLIDADDLESATVLTSQVCIIGAGPVGIALSLRLAALGVDSLLLESGGFEMEEATQALAAGDSGDYFDLTTTRLRRLGGTTNHWGGQSRPLEVVDFEATQWRGGYGWPIAHAELSTYLDDAVDFLGLPDTSFENERWFPDEAGVPAGVLEDKVFQIRPLLVGEAYRDALVTSDRVTLVLHANVTQVRLDTTSGTVSSVQIATLSGVECSAEAQTYVVATGGIESARLLLASTDDAPQGVGNGSGLVGRYFADHHAIGPLPIVPGTAPMPESLVEPAGEGDVDPNVPTNVVRMPAPTAAMQRDDGLVGFHVVMLAIDLDFDSEGVQELFVQGIEKLVHLGTDGTEESRSVVVGFEQVPNPDSRVTLGDDVDAFGRPVASVHWELTDDDEAHMKRAMELIARDLAIRGIGRLRMLPIEGSWRDIVMGQHHHMGTLRMGTTPADSVVNTDLRFHDVSNLYAVGSAVFPTYGHVNPTLNSIALAQRLADHLDAELG